MAQTFDTTVGGASANSYSSLVAANNYHDSNLNRSEWDESGDSKKERALSMATRVLDERYDFVGAIVTTTQKLRWPRSGALDRDARVILTTVIPNAIIEATAELALWLLKSDRWVEPDGKGLKSVKLDTLNIVFDKDEEGLDRAAIIPQVVKEMLGHLGQVQGSMSVKLVRV